MGRPRRHVDQDRRDRADEHAILASGYSDLVYDAATNKIVLYYYFNQLHLGVQRRDAGPGPRSPRPTPTRVDTSTYPPYYYTPVVYDAGRQKLVLFGGQSYGARCGT